MRTAKAHVSVTRRISGNKSDIKRIRAMLADGQSVKNIGLKLNIQESFIVSLMPEEAKPAPKPKAKPKAGAKTSGSGTK